MKIRAASSDKRPISEETLGAASASLLQDYVTKSELASEFNVSQRTVERWVRLRLIPQPVRLGRKSLFHIQSIRDHLLQRLNNSGQSNRRRR